MSGGQGESMDRMRSVLLIGGPDAGKSNFLFRLWLVIDDKTGLLISNGLPNQVEYLRTGAESLLSGEFAPRTSKEVLDHSPIPVKSSTGTSLSGQLLVPDCSGEKWLAIYDKREWSSDWEELISRETGCLIFVRPTSEKIVAPLDWISCFKQFGSAENPNSGTEPATNESSDGQGEELVRVTPTQVVMVEWLQFLRRAFTDRVAGNFRPRVGVVVTAWDAVPSDQKDAGPQAYLAANFPMFEHFLQANEADFDVEVFGASVAGGDLTSEPGFKKRYLDNNPRTAGYVVHSLEGQLQQSSDHTLPVAWALGLVDGIDRKEGDGS